MAIIFIDKTTEASNNPLSGNFTLPGGWQVGDVAICWWYTMNGQKTFTPPIEVTQKRTAASALYGTIWIGHRILQAGDTTFAWASSDKIGSSTIWGCSVFHGVHSSVWDTDSGTPITFTDLINPNPPSVTTINDKAVVLPVFGQRNDYVTLTSPAGYSSAGENKDIGGADASAGIAYKEKSPAGLEDPPAWGGGPAVPANGYVWTGALKAGAILKTISELFGFTDSCIGFKRISFLETFSSLEVLRFPWYPKNIWELLHLTPTSQKRAELASKEETIQLSDLSTPAWCQPLIEGLNLTKNLLFTVLKPLSQTLALLNYSTFITSKFLGQTVQVTESFFIAKVAKILHTLKIMVTSIFDSEYLIDSFSSVNSTNTFVADVHPSDSAYTSASGQCFYLSRDTKITKADFYCWKIGNPTGTLVVRVYRMIGTYGSTGIPQEPSLGESESKDVSGISSTVPTWYTWNFTSPLYLEGGNYYVVVILGKTGVWDESNALRGYGSSSGGHPGNLSRYVQEGGWLSNSVWDIDFRIYGKETGPDYHIIPILFSTSFETGNLIRLDTFGGNPLPSIVTSQHHHGSYSLYIYGNWTYTWAQKAIASNPVHVSAWIYKANSWSFYKPAYTITVRSQDGTLIASFCMEAATVSKMGVYYRNNSSYVTLDTDLDWPIEQWWQYELRVLTGAGTGEVKLWVNRTLKINLTGLNNADKGEPKYMELGTRGHSSGYGPDLYFDCVVASNEYIGMAGEPAPQEKFYTQILSLPGICLNRFTKWLFPSSNFSDVIISFSTKKVLKEQEWVLLREVED